MITALDLEDGERNNIKVSGKLLIHDICLPSPSHSILIPYLSQKILPHPPPQTPNTEDPNPLSPPPTTHHVLRLLPTPPYHFERLDKDKAILLIVDHQLGLLQLVNDFTPAEFRNNVLAHAELGRLFSLPTILTTSAENGPDGLLSKEITQMYPDPPFIRRNGEVNAWDNADFRKAVEATGCKQVILGGIVTEVCTMFLALSLREAGYSVLANTEASGTGTVKLAEDANRRMENAGVHLVSLSPFSFPSPISRPRKVIVS